jgi:cytochrome P450
MVRVPIVGVNRSERLWGPDAEKFIPERWLVPEEESAKSAAKKEEIQGYKHLLTFGYGPRMCLGRNFALTEFKVRFFITL